MTENLTRQRLSQYLEAERAILSGAQSYQIADRVLTRANLKEIQSKIDELIAEINLEENKFGRTKRAVFID